MLLPRNTRFDRGRVDDGSKMNDKIYNTVVDAAAEGMVEFFHGYTYSAHPVACAAGMATLDIYDREGLLTRASGDIGSYWENALHSLADLEDAASYAVSVITPPAS